MFLYKANPPSYSAIFYNDHLYIRTGWRRRRCELCWWDHWDKIHSQDVWCLQVWYIGTNSFGEPTAPISSIFLINVGTVLPQYMISCPRRP